MEKEMGVAELNSTGPMEVISCHDILPVIDVEVDVRMEIFETTSWYMESIGPNEDKGDVFLYVNDNGQGYKCMGIILSMDNIMSAYGVPCNFAQVECPQQKKLFGIELQWSKYSPIMMGPSKNGREGSMIKMGWDIPNLSKWITDSGLSSCEDIVEGFKKVKAKQLEEGKALSSKIYSSIIKDTLKGKRPHTLGNDVSSRIHLVERDLTNYLAMRKSGSVRRTKEKIYKAKVLKIDGEKETPFKKIQFMGKQPELVNDKDIASKNTKEKVTMSDSNIEKASQPKVLKEKRKVNTSSSRRNETRKKPHSGRSSTRGGEDIVPQGYETIANQPRTGDIIGMDVTTLEMAQPLNQAGPNESVNNLSKALEKGASLRVCLMWLI
ncbi:hypothetical protein O6H91_08G086300 [Diphasiastrum complanatum]|uniref:Uncharacterized protein n=1 Tax=Diphasiastrum complanatum TaxID=34168 RepID=A0ACC2CZP7_DIPCM|nr:hypothetical protein O6H91_08G086300 [Diphasiastrum complanatum]